MANVDALKTNTALKAVEILNPTQSVRFLTTISQLQLRIRSWGLQREAGAQESGENEWCEIDMNSLSFFSFSRGHQMFGLGSKVFV